jgi:anti-sigma-K factor RskA
MSDFDPTPFRSLQSELKKLAESQISVPPELDHEILSQAKRSFAHRRRQQMWFWRIGAGLAAAAVLALAVRLFVPQKVAMAPVALAHPQLTQVADVNHDGTVDILDAYIVARQIARHEPLDPAWDINGDGVVDQKDVDLIAGMAVRVDGGSQ